MTDEMTTTTTVSSGGTTTTATNPNLQELEETVSRLSSHKGVESVFILQSQTGNIVVAQAGSSSTAGDTATLTSTARHIQQIVQATQAWIHVPSSSSDNHNNTSTDTSTITDMDNISFVQIRTLHNRELYIAPHGGYVLAVTKKL
jgi:hypothetical protein